MTLEDVIEKRRRSWEKRHDIEYDRQLSKAAVDYIHQRPELAAQIKAAPWKLIEVAFTIVDKQKHTVPFFLNEVQQDFVQHLESRDSDKPLFVLKGRQQGFTSLVTAIQLCFAIVKRNFSGFTVADCNDNTAAIFNDKARVVYNGLPESLKPHEKYNNRRELFFDRLNSSWRIATASSDIGRSKTIEFCHFSEVAFYDCQLSDLQKSIGEAFVKGAIVIYETTAHGYNEAKDLWDSGACTNLFYEWWRTGEYQSNNLTVLADLPDEWIKARVAMLRHKGLTEQQLAWYVQKYNSYLDKNSIRQEYPCMPEEAFIASGDCEFDNEMVTAQLERVRNLQAVKKGYFDYRKSRPADVEDVDSVIISDIRWVDNSDGPITIHSVPEEDKEKGKKPYAIGGDTAGEGSDWFTAKVVDNITQKTVATYRKQRTADDLYAEQIYCLGRYYNDALVAIEVNFSYEPTKRLLNCGYPNVLNREKVDAITNQVEQKFGFRTSSATRPVIISELKRKWRESQGTIEVDVETLREMLTFVANESGKPEALAGKHDDLVMALAIAHYASDRGDHTWKAPEAEKSFIEEMFPGYHPEGTDNDGYISWED